MNLINYSLSFYTCISKLYNVTGLILILLTLASCSALSDKNNRYLGYPLVGGWANYTKTEIGPNEYIIKTFASNGVSKADLKKDYQLYVNALCQPKKPTYSYKIKTTTYLGSAMKPGLSVRTTGLDLISTVKCE